MRLFNRRPGYRKVPDDAFVISPEESEVIRQIACPKCGRTDGLFYAGSMRSGRRLDIARIGFYPAVMFLSVVLAVIFYLVLIRRYEEKKKTGAGETRCAACSATIERKDAAL